jgi:hypothetical protein
VLVVRGVHAGDDDRVRSLAREHLVHLGKPVGSRRHRSGGASSIHGQLQPAGVRVEARHQPAAIGKSPGEGLAVEGRARAQTDQRIAPGAPRSRSISATGALLDQRLP